LEIHLMKKSLIAFAIFGAFAASASAQSSVTLYGIIDAGVVSTDNQSSAGARTMRLDSGVLTTSRWGISGTESLEGNLKANFNLEGTLSNDTGALGVPSASNPATTSTTSIFDRAATVGMSGDFGAITMGRQNLAGIHVLAMADPMGLAHAPSNPNVLYGAQNSGALYGGWGVNGANSSALRQSNSVKYVTPTNAYGIGGAAMYAMGETTTSLSASSYAGASAYFTDGVSGVAVAYGKAKDTTGLSSIETYAVGGKLKAADAVTVKATFVENTVTGGAQSTRKIAVFGFGADFALSPATTLTAAYYGTTLSGTSPLGAGKADQYIGIAKYAFSKRTVLYTSLTYIKAGSAAAADQSMAANLIAVGSNKDHAKRFAVGINHSF
jgi:predicted porin